jgi:hypothetical protein
MERGRRNLLLVGGIAVLAAAGIGTAIVMRNQGNEPAQPMVEAVIVSSSTPVTTAAAFPVAPDIACTGIPGPAPDPLGGIVSHELREIAVMALIHRNEIYLSNDAWCIRKFMSEQLVVLEARAKFLSEPDDVVVSSSAFFASLLPIPDPVAFRAQMLGEGTEWTYQEGELFFMTEARGRGPQVTATDEDGNPVEIESEGPGSFGSTVQYRNGRWY